MQQISSQHRISCNPYIFRYLFFVCTQFTIIYNFLVISSIIQKWYKKIFCIHLIIFNCSVCFMTLNVVCLVTASCEFEKDMLFFQHQVAMSINFNFACWFIVLPRYTIQFLILCLFVLSSTKKLLLRFPTTVMNLTISLLVLLHNFPAFYLHIDILDFYFKIFSLLL